MPRLTTRTKLKLARILSACAIRLRKFKGKGSLDQFERKQVLWSLDLREGIDLSIYLFGQFERDVFRAYRKVIGPGDTILDIGANIGAHTLPMARLVGPDGHVFAFEPTSFAYLKLVQNLNLNPLLSNSVAPFQAFLSASADEKAPATIPSSWNLFADSYETHKQHGGSFKLIDGASTFTLDSFIQDKKICKVDLIKLDVDGNELSVLQGAQGLLSEFKPRILMEFALDYSTEDFKALLRLLKRHRYSCEIANTKTKLSLDIDSLRRIIPENGSINVMLSQP